MSAPSTANALLRGRHLPSRLRQLRVLAGDFLRSLALLPRDRGVFAQLETICLFLGCPRSGHTLVGALLDAHPQVMLAQELGVLRLVLAGFPRRQIYSLLLDSSQRAALHQRSQGHAGRSVDYGVPGQWQGRFRQLRVLGDKHGEGLVLRLQARPWLLGRLERVFSRLRFVHCVRHPCDAIASIALRKGRALSLADSVRYYFSLCQTICELKRKLGSTRIHELRHEDFLADPEGGLRQLAAFLGVPAPADWLVDCRTVVRATPRRTRDQWKWSPALLEEVARRMAGVPFLASYRLDER